MFPQYYCFPSWHTHFSRAIFYFPYDCTLLVCFALCFFIHGLICIFTWYYFSFNEPPHRRYWGIMHFYTNSATSGHLGMLICCISCLLTGYFNLEQCKWDGIFLFFSFLVFFPLFSYEDLLSFISCCRCFAKTFCFVQKLLDNVSNSLNKRGITHTTLNTENRKFNKTLSLAQCTRMWSTNS